jgi:hypothetical protein
MSKFTVAFHEKVLNFIEYFNDGPNIHNPHYKYIKNIKYDNQLYFIYMSGVEISLFKSHLVELIIDFILVETIYYKTPDKKPTDRYIIYKQLFLKLLADLLKNNYEDIRREFTFRIIKTSDTFIKYIESENLLYLLSRIKPIKYMWAFELEIKRAEYIYNELINYDKCGLKLAWLSAVAKTYYL